MMHFGMGWIADILAIFIRLVRSVSDPFWRVLALQMTATHPNIMSKEVLQCIKTAIDLFGVGQNPKNQHFHIYRKS